MDQKESKAPGAFPVVCAVVFVTCAAAGCHLARTAGLVFFRPLAMLLGWAGLVAVASLFPRLPGWLRGLLLTAGGIAVIAVPGRFYLPGQGVTADLTDDRARQIAVVLSIVTFVVHFLATYGSHRRKEVPGPVLDTLVPLARLVAAALAVTVATLVALVFFQKVWVRQVEVAFALATAALVAEAVVRAVARMYLPRRLRADHPFGHGVLLPAVFGHSGPLQSLAATMEKIFGVRIEESWLALLGKRMAAPLALLVLLGLWLSTGLTRIPVDSHGVRVDRGVFRERALAPGLAFHPPWPWSEVRLVNTGRVEELALGFERDLSRPVLWAEKHFDGEQNLLVGGGEELLTVNVPVHYRIRDAVAWLRHGTGARECLASLGYHELLAITGSHDSFQLMITDRDEVADRLKARLQQSCDRLDLGIEIVFVGLKDVHPPVEVAPAFQDVVSAEEQRLSLIDQARTASVASLADARIAAVQATVGADAAATERQQRATGEAARFLAPLETWALHPAVFTTRLRLDTLEGALAETRQLYILPAGAHRHSTFLLGNPAALPAANGLPAPVVRPPNPVIRTTVLPARN
ncbi:protease modulator HflK [Luteolibacter sp. LG18]|uniref:protease modulator HflK n=1 Tax=Luteolibacter sp. LG18 TaxID=2819286 RepID=UPI002B2CF236|nr:hypothetical protein llg_27490 [Luteolibacter sp. LG18]